MFKEFSRCSRKGFIVSVLTGGTTILVFAVLSSLTGNSYLLKAGFVVGLVGARLAEVVYSRNCSFPRAGFEGAVLALVGILLLAADGLLTGLWA